MPQIDVSNPDDRKKVADALVTLLSAGADLNETDLDDGTNPFGDIGPSEALLTLKREVPNITHAELAQWSQAIYASAANVNKFTNLVKIIKGAVNLAKTGIPGL